MLCVSLVPNKNCKQVQHSKTKNAIWYYKDNTRREFYPKTSNVIVITKEDNDIKLCVLHEKVSGHTGK